MDEQGVFYVLLNDELPTLIRSLFLEVRNQKGMRRLLLYNVLSLEVLFCIYYL